VTAGGLRTTSDPIAGDADAVVDDLVAPTFYVGSGGRAPVVLDGCARRP
jgi:hypothetical protein